MEVKQARPEWPGLLRADKPELTSKHTSGGVFTQSSGMFNAISSFSLTTNLSSNVVELRQT